MTRSGISAVVLDLDGTLVDSLPGIEASLRFAVEQCLPGRSLPDVRAVIGPPVGLMLRALFPDLAEDDLARTVAEFRLHYDIEGCLRSRLYDGVCETLAALTRSAVALFILTNKPLRPTLRILEAVALRDQFRAVVCPDSSDPAFAIKAEGAKRLTQEYGLAPGSTMLVGDGPDDADAAAACGFAFAAAAYGYGNVLGRRVIESRIILKNFSELAGAVL
jgi:phosphoglycolate phosphatase